VPFQRSLATLPLEILVEIVSYLPFDGRVASRSVCRPLNCAEYHQRPHHLPEVAVYRTSPKELTLFAETDSANTGETWLACRSGPGHVLNAWHRLGARNRDRELTTISHHHLWCWEEAPLGRVGEAMNDLMRNAHVDVLKLNQLTLTEGVNDYLRSSLSGTSIDSIFATLNYQLSDDQSLDWLTEVPTKGLTLYTRSLSSSSFPFSTLFLLKAARLPRVILHSKSDRGSSAVTSPLITDSLLLSLLSTTCSCLRLLFNCSSLSSIGLLSAIQFLRSLPTTKGFTVYIQSEVADELMELLDDGRGRPFPVPDCKMDKQNEKIAIKDLWMEKAYREIRYLHIASSEGSQYAIDDSEKSFFRPISK
ncbi:hypothetical protein PENTCL1PPCAC_17300, partial [Pristionchus entomophagus]